MPAAKKSVMKQPKMVAEKKRVAKVQIRQVSHSKINNSNKMAPEEQVPKWRYFFGAFRILIGFLFLWTFLDKLFGFGISTAPGKAWINGVSPVTGFLAHATQGPFVNIFHSIASSNVVAWLFMLGLLFIGLTMILGIGMKLGAIAGTTLLFLMWVSEIPPSTDPFLDYHWFYAFTLIALTLTGSGRFIGLGKWWSNLGFVKKCRILE